MGHAAIPFSIYVNNECDCNKISQKRDITTVSAFDVIFDENLIIMALRRGGKALIFHCQCPLRVNY